MSIFLYYVGYIYRYQALIGNTLEMNGDFLIAYFALGKLKVIGFFTF